MNSTTPYFYKSIIYSSFVAADFTLVALAMLALQSSFNGLANHLRE
jgi:hypothetical protein